MNMITTSSLFLRALCALRVPSSGIELRNTLQQSVSIADMVVSDASGFGAAHKLTLGGSGCPESIPPAGYLVLCSTSSSPPKGAAIFEFNATRTTTPAIFSEHAASCGFSFALAPGVEIKLFKSDGALMSASPPASIVLTEYGLSTADGPNSVWMLLHDNTWAAKQWVMNGAGNAGRTFDMDPLTFVKFGDFDNNGTERKVLHESFSY